MIEREGYTVLCPCARCKLYSGTLCSLYPARYALCPVRVMLLSLSRPRNALSPTDRGIFSIITDLIKDAHLILFLPSTTQVLTFLIDSSRFRYPERAIVFLAVCYLVVGCAYVAGLGAGDSVSCREPFPPPVKLGRLQMMSTITQVSRRRCSSGISFHILFNNFPPRQSLSLSLSLSARRVIAKPPHAPYYSWHCISAAWPPLRGGRAWRSPGSSLPASNGATRQLKINRIYSIWSLGPCPPCRPSPCWRWPKLKVSLFFISVLHLLINAHTSNIIGCHLEVILNEKLTNLTRLNSQLAARARPCHH